MKNKETKSLTEKTVRKIAREEIIKYEIEKSDRHTLTDKLANQEIEKRQGHKSNNQ
jgi:hypothetical protein